MAKMRVRAIVVLVLIALGCDRTAQKQVGTSVSRGIERELGKNATEIDVALIAKDFRWDSVFIFNPYAAGNQICSTIRVREPQCSAFGIRDVDEGEFALVFMDGRAVARVEYCPRRLANFDESNRCLAKSIAKSSAKFDVQRKDGVLIVCR